MGHWADLKCLNSLSLGWYETQIIQRNCLGIFDLHFTRTGCIASIRKHFVVFHSIGTNYNKLTSTGTEPAVSQENIVV